MGTVYQKVKGVQSRDSYASHAEENQPYERLNYYWLHPWRRRSEEERFSVKN